MSDTNRIKKFFESYNKCDAKDILMELAKFIDRLPSLTHDEEEQALKIYNTTNELSLREIREDIIDKRAVKK